MCSVDLNDNVQVVYRDSLFWYQVVEYRSVLENISAFTRQIEKTEGIKHSTAHRVCSGNHIFTVTFLKPDVTLDLADISHMNGNVSVSASDQLVINLYTTMYRVPIKP